MITLEALDEIIERIDASIGGLRWSVAIGDMGHGFFVQLRYMEADIETGMPEIQTGRKWYISPHSTASEVVQTVLKAALTSAEHMVREHFRYRGVAVFGPHLDVEALVELVSAGRTAKRNPKR